MIAQAFAYNGVFFTYALVLGRFYGVASSDVGLYLLPFAAGNLLGPIVLGPLFDTVGRRRDDRDHLRRERRCSSRSPAMASLARGLLGRRRRRPLWCAVFFVASAAASSAYLTVSELFPVELRGMAIALFYAVGTGVGGVVAPALFGALIQTGRRESLFIGYGIGAALLLGAAGVAAALGVDAERRSLEEISRGELT